ncbi:MAG: YjbQ family protein [Nitrospirae bacterium]|nr:YjbQ family protein [Nitrospirota bacterium]
MTHSDTISLRTKGFTDIFDITDNVKAIASESGVTDGLVTVFCSTGTITTIEYEAGVFGELIKSIDKIKSLCDGNGFSHVKDAIRKCSIGIPIVKGKLTLGTWQQIVFIDLDDRSGEANIVVQVIGE